MDENEDIKNDSIDFDLLINRLESDSVKWKKYAGRDIIPMWVADMDFLSPPAIRRALHDRVDHGVFGYAIPSPELVETIVSHLKKTYAWAIDSRWIVWLPGLVCGLNVVCRSIGETGRNAVLTTLPVYPPFLSAPKLAGHELQTTTMVYDCSYHWRIDLADLESSANDCTRLFILCNPHNPTGRMFTEQELSGLAEICLRNNWLICSDEIHCDLTLEPHRRHLPIACLSPEVQDRTITLMAPSKTYNMPGLGCSFAIISNDALRRRFAHTMAGIVPHVSLLGLTATQAAYAHGQSWLNRLLNYLRLNQELVFQTINTMSGLKMGRVEATYLAWIDTRGSGIQKPVEFFESAGIGLSGGADFGMDGFVRMNFGCPRPLLSEALEKMADAMNARPKVAGVEN